MISAHFPLSRPASAAASEQANIREGENKDAIVSLAEKLDINSDQTNFLSHQPQDNLPYSLTSTDVSVVTVREETEGICVSSKLYTAMAAGTPVLVISRPSNNKARIVDRFNAGINVSPGNVQGVADAVNQWADNPELVEQQGENARKAFEENFTQERSVREYYNMLLD